MSESRSSDEQSRNSGNTASETGDERPPGQTRAAWRWWIGGALLLAVLAAVAVYLAWPRLAPPPEPPSLDLKGVQKTVADLVRQAREDVLQTPRSHEAWGHLGMVLMAHQYDPQAVACFAAAERLEPKEFRWPYYRGIVLSVTDRVAAIACYERAQEIRDDYANVRMRMAELLLAEERFDDAEAQFRSALQMQPFEPRALLGLARTFFRRGDYEQSVEWAESAVDYARDSKPPREFLAKVYQRLGRREEALRVLENMPRDPLFWYDTYTQAVLELRRDTHWSLYQGEEMIARNRFQDAARVLEQAIASDPDAPPSVHALLGRALCQSGELDRAADALDRGLRLYPQSPEVRFHRGVVHLLKEEYPPSAAMFREAIEQKPDYYLAHYNLGHSLHHMNQTEQAVAAFRDAVKFRPDYAPAHFNLGKLLAESGQTSEGIEHLKTAVSIRPHDTESQELLKKLEQGAEEKPAPEQAKEPEQEPPEKP